MDFVDSVDYCVDTVDIAAVRVAGKEGGEQRASGFSIGLDERQWLSAGYAWHSRPRTTTLSSNLRNGGDESG